VSGGKYQLKNYVKYPWYRGVRVRVFNTTFNNISVISK
jgi:hypothetical protein